MSHEHASKMADTSNVCSRVCLGFHEKKAARYMALSDRNPPVTTQKAFNDN